MYEWQNVSNENIRIVRFQQESDKLYKYLRNDEFTYLIILSFCGSIRR